MQWVDFEYHGRAPWCLLLVPPLRVWCPASCVSHELRICTLERWGEFRKATNTPKFLSETSNDSFPFPFSMISSERNCLSPFPSLPSWMAVISSTAVTVEVNRCNDLSFNLKRSKYSVSQVILLDIWSSTRPEIPYNRFAPSGVSKSFHTSVSEAFAESLILNRQYPSEVSYRTSIFTES